MKTKHIANLPLLDALSTDTLSAIAPMLSRRRESAGKYVIRQGDHDSDLYLLEEGIVEAVYDAEGEEIVLSTFEGKDFFGEIGFVERKPRSSAIRAKTDVKLVLMPTNVVPILVEVDPLGLSELYRRLFIGTSERLRVANSVISGYYCDLVERQGRDEFERELRHLLVHDLRSPLAVCETGIGLLLEQAHKYGPLTAKQVRVLTRSRRSALFLRRLIEEILEVGRSESGQERLEWVTIRSILLEALLQSIGGLRGPSLEDVRNLSDFDEVRRALAAQELHIEASEDILSTQLLTDRYRLMQVIMNLVGNAYRHAPGWLCIRIGIEAQQMTFAVVDRGPGIPPAKRKAIFNPHEQVAMKTAGIQRGFGLGLAGAAQLVKAMEGTIHAEDGDNGRGTMMVFSIPVREHR